MNAALFRKLVPALALAALAASCSSEKAATTAGQGDGGAGVTTPVADANHADIADAVPENMRLMARLDGDFIGNGLAGTILVAADEDHYELRVLARTRSLVNDDVATDTIDSLTLESSSYGPPTLSLADRVLTVEHVTGGGSSTRATYRYRFDSDEDRMRLIGMQVERHVRDVAHDTVSWDALSGERIARLGVPAEGGAPDDAAYRYGPEHRAMLTASPVHMAQTPDPDELLDAALAQVPGSGRCDEDDFDCDRAVYPSEETLFR